MDQNGQGMRTITIYRHNHAHRGFTSLKDFQLLIEDNVPYNIRLDGVDQGAVTATSPLTLKMSTGPHEIHLIRMKIPIPRSKIKIPAGTEDFEAYAFNDELYAGPIYCQFRADLKQFLLKLFTGQGIRERIQMPNNRNQNIYVRFHSDGISLEWDLAQTKGLAQWASGRGEEKIRYSSIGLTPPVGADAYNFWRYIKEVAEEFITSNEQIDMECDHLGGFRPKTIHKLY